MLDHLRAVEALLKQEGHPVHLVAAPPSAAPPYFVLGGRAWDDAAEPTVAGACGSLDTDLRVTATAGTPAGVLMLLAAARARLGRANPTVTDRWATTAWVRSEFVDVDRDVTIPGTDLHPAWGVDTYRLTSEPA